MVEPPAATSFLLGHPPVRTSSFYWRRPLRPSRQKETIDRGMSGNPSSSQPVGTTRARFQTSPENLLSDQNYPSNSHPAFCQHPNDEIETVRIALYTTRLVCSAMPSISRRCTVFGNPPPPLRFFAVKMQRGRCQGEMKHGGSDIAPLHPLLPRNRRRSVLRLFQA
jgi:hypothetical protein